MPFKLLILGGGAIVTECHLPALKALGWLSSCTVVEPLASNAEKVNARFPAVAIERESYETFLSRASVRTSFDGVLVALPNTLHVEAARRCLQDGLPVLCEKPLGLNASECDYLSELASRSGRLLAVGMVRRWLPSISALRRALTESLIGKVTAVELEDGGNPATWPWDTETVFRRDQGGVLLNMGIHFLDYLQWIFGELQPISYSDDWGGGIEVNCAFKLQTQKGVPVRLAISWTHGLKNSLRIVGTDGTLIVRKDVFDSCQWESGDGGLLAELRLDQPFQSGAWRATFEACFVEQLWYFARAAKGAADSNNVVTAAEAARSQRLVDWAYARRGTERPGLKPPSMQPHPKKDPACVVVTGGTGFIGRHLVARLTELGMMEIRVPVRNFRTGAEVSRYPVKMQRIDLLSQESCRNSVRGARYVFHLAYGTGSRSANVTIDGTRNMVRAAIAEHVECIVVFSTCTVYGHPETSRPVDESFPLNPVLGDYGYSKAQMHRDCLNIAQQAKSTRVVLITPGSVIGPGSSLFCALPCEMASKRAFCWIDGGSGIANYTYVGNLVDAAVLAAKEVSTHGEDFIIVDGQCSWRALLAPLLEPWNASIADLSADEFGRLTRGTKTAKLGDVLRSVLAAPDVMAAISNHPVLGYGKNWFVRSFPRLHDKVQALRPAMGFINLQANGNPGTPPDWLADIFGNWNVRFSSAKAQQLLGWHPVVDLQAAQRASIQWLKERGLRPDGSEVDSGDDRRATAVEVARQSEF